MAAAVRTGLAKQEVVRSVWELRHNLTANDAAYVALAEALQCPLVTGDARISRIPGLRCLITVLPG
jgi:predicted nucleic acid-binding protein